MAGFTLKDPSRIGTAVLGAGRMGEGAAVSLTMFPLLLALLILEVRYLTRRSA